MPEKRSKRDGLTLTRTASTSTPAGAIGKAWLDFFNESNHKSRRDRVVDGALETSVCGSYARAHALAIASALAAAQHERLHEHARSCAAGEIFRHIWRADGGRRWLSGRLHSRLRATATLLQRYGAAGTSEGGRHVAVKCYFH